MRLLEKICICITVEVYWRWYKIAWVKNLNATIFLCCSIICQINKMVCLLPAKRYLTRLIICVFWWLCKRASMLRKRKSVKLNLFKMYIVHADSKKLNLFIKALVIVIWILAVGWRNMIRKMLAFCFGLKNHHSL